MKIKYIFGLAFTSLISMVSCSLDENISLITTPDTFWESKAQCKASLNSCYIPMNGIYNGTFLLATEAVTDLGWSNSGAQDAQLDISPATPRFGATVWQLGYRGVMYCNTAIEGISGSTLDDETKLPMVAEAKVMRALYYYILTSFFGDVPFYTIDVSDQNIMHTVARLPRMSAIETRNKLIDDLKTCVPAMEQIRANQIKECHAGAPLGWMLMAKMAMWNKDADTALEAIEKLEAIYGDLSQYPLSDVPFSVKNAPEAIFEIQHTYTPGGMIYTSNVACTCMPWPRNGNNSVYAGVEIPELGNTANTYVPLKLNAFMYNNLQPENGLDLRQPMTHISGWNGVTFPDKIHYPGPKFWCYNMFGSYDGNNYKIFRYADVVLMKAECLYMKRVSGDDAVELLNTVRRRAGLEDYTFRSWTRFFEAIMDERARELFGEFQRKFDMVRWGNWYERTLIYNTFSKLRQNILPCHEYYPIPDVQVTYSGGALDNKAYEAYGL